MHGAFAACTQVFEAHLIDIERGAALRVVAIDNEAVVRLVAEVGRTVDVVHLHAALLPVQVGTVHLARMGHQDEEHAVLGGKAHHAVQAVADELQLRHGGLLLVRLQTVQRVDDHDAHTPSGHQLAGTLQHLVQRVAVVGWQDVVHILRTPPLGRAVEVGRHASSALELVPRQLLDELAQVVLDGHILGREVGRPPSVAQAEAQHQFVEELTLSVTRPSGDDHEASRLEGTQPVQVEQSHLRTALHPVLEEGIQSLAHILGGEHPFDGHLLGRFDAADDLLASVAAQHLVGILAPLRPVHHAAPLRSQAAGQFVAQLQSHGIVVQSEDYLLLVLEMGLHEAVHPREVAVASAGHTDGLGKSALHEGERVEFPFGDVAHRAVVDSIHVVGYQFRSAHQRELLVQGACLDVDELAAVEVVEGEGQTQPKTHPIPPCEGGGLNTPLLIVSAIFKSSLTGRI